MVCAVCLSILFCITKPATSHSYVQPVQQTKTGTVSTQILGTCSVCGYPLRRPSIVVVESHHRPSSLWSSAHFTAGQMNGLSVIRSKCANILYATLGGGRTAFVNVLHRSTAANSQIRWATGSTYQPVNWFVICQNSRWSYTEVSCCVGEVERVNWRETSGETGWVIGMVI